MYKITMLDRMILSSIIKNNKNKLQIHYDTDIDIQIIQKVLEDLIIKNILIIKNDEYKINPNLSSDQLKDLKSKEYLKSEKRQIASSLIDEDLVNLEKFYLTKKDETIFKGMIKNLELFIQEAKKSTSQTKNETILFWGMNNYKSILDKTIFG